MSFPVPAILQQTTLPAVDINLEFADALALAQQEKAESTRRAYGSDFRIFQSYCAERGANALPASAETVAAFLARENSNGAKPSTIGRRVASILYAHKLAALSSPTDDERVRAVMRGIRRSRGVAPVKKAPAGAATVLTMCANAGEKIASLRDRALLLIGFSIAARRSELVALDVADIADVENGILITIRRSKTDRATIAAIRFTSASLRSAHCRTSIIESSLGTNEIRSDGCRI
jgi:site-specific recombinase XerD